MNLIYEKQLTALMALCCLSLFVSAHPAQVSIRMIGYDAGIHKNFAEITIPDPNYPYKEQIKISEDGIIQATLLINYTRELIFSYIDASVAIVISPGDQVELEFSINELLTPDSNPKAVIKGQHKTCNTLIFKYGPTIQALVDESSRAMKMPEKPSEAAYQLLRTQELANQLNQLGNFMAEKHITDTLFADWARAQIRYAAATDLCTYPFIGKINRAISESDAYFDFLKDFTAPKQFIASTRAYCEYIKTLASTLTIIANISDKHAPERARLQKDSMPDFPIKFSIMVDRLAGTQREMALTQLFLRSARIPETYLDSLRQYVPAERLQQVEADRSRSIPILQLLNDFPLPEAEKKPLAELYTSVQGKAVFHDFWFLSCYPCMVELPHYNQLIAQAGEGVEFVFFGVYMNEKEWKTALEKYRLKGRHLLLTPNQIAFFERYFMVKGFPHHRLVNAKGLIMDELIPAIRPAHDEVVLQKIAKAVRAE